MVQLAMVNLLQIIVIVKIRYDMPHILSLVIMHTCLRFFTMRESFSEGRLLDSVH